MSTSITNYASLQTALTNWLHRSDLSSFIPDFIALAETQLSVDLTDARWMWTTASFTTTAGSNVVSLPTDLIELKRVKIFSNPNQTCTYMPPEAFEATYNDSTNTNTPDAYSMTGLNIELGPSPDQVYTGEFLYRQMIPALSNSNTTNWLITNFPNLYMWGSILAAQVYLQNDDRLPIIADLYAKAVAQLNGIKWNRGGSLAMVVQ